jgi:type IV pilus assembly PilX-like protein
MNAMARRSICGGLRDERGSALVAGLMLVFLMTMLGLALFGVARLDARLRLNSQTGVQALEIAEAGLERGLHLFYLEFTCGPTMTSPITAANCANPPTTDPLNVPPTYVPPSYLAPPNGNNQLARIPLNVGCPAAVVPDGAVGFKLLKQNQAFAGGTYTLCIRRWIDPATGNPVDNPHKAQFRSLGVLTSITGTIARIVQIDTTATVTANKPHAPFAIGGPAAGAIRGNALIAGSLQFVKCPGAGCVVATFGGGGGIQNNYSGLHAILHDRIPWRYADGTTVNTLNAVLKVKEGQIQITSNSACVGAQESGSGCGGGGNTPFQDTMSGIYMGASGTWGGSKGNCSAGLNGATTTNRNCNVWTSAQGPYPAGEPVSIPLLSDSTIIDDKGYRCFFNPPGAACPNAADPLPGGTNFPEYFYTGAWRIDSSRGDAGCDINVTGTAADCTTVLNALQAGATPDFGAGPAPVLPIKPTACTRQGATDSSSCTLTLAAGHIIGMIDGQPIRPDLEPINVYLKRLAAAPAGTPTFKTSPVDPVLDNRMYYQGKIMILADNPAGTPGFEIDQGLLPESTTNQPWCSLGTYLCGYAYPANHFLGLLTTGNILLGAGGSRDILAQFFAANPAGTAKFYVNGGIGNTQVAGTLTAQQFDFTGAGGVPSLFQAPWNLSALPGAAGPAAGAFVSIGSDNWKQIQ